LLHRHYPVSTLLRASPPPTRPGLTLAGCPLRLPPLSTSVSRASWTFFRGMPSLSTPAKLQSASVAGFPCNAGLPRQSDRSASASLVSGPRRAFTCVRAYLFAGSPSDPFHRRLRRIRCLLRRFDCYWASDPSQAGLSPARIPTPSRRTDWLRGASHCAIRGNVVATVPVPCFRRHCHRAPWKKGTGTVARDAIWRGEV
jgi:hypothetical protein